jgi:hypothetical protein
MPLPLSYTCHRATSAPSLDGTGRDPVWARAAWTSDFVDIEGEGKPRPRFRTRVKMLHDDQFLYVLAEMEEPHVCASLTTRNSIIYRDNDFEIFIDPDGDRIHYYEFEINALNTILELQLDKPYIDGGNYTFCQSERIRTAVHVNGSLNDPSDRDAGWTTEVAIAFADLAKLSRGVRAPFPIEGDTWRINFSRVEWTWNIEDGKYVKVSKPEDNWVWTPQGVVDMHRPERWGYLKFAR